MKTRLDRLTPHPENPRLGDVDAIQASLESFGQYRPIIASKTTGHILAGHHTAQAARNLGWTSIDVHWIDRLDADQERRILLADNRTADLGDYDDEHLAETLTLLAAEEWAGTGYTPDDLEDLHVLIEQSATPPPEPVEPEHAGRRAMILEYPVPVFLWMQDRLAELQPARGNSTTAVVLDLIADATSRPVPA